MKKTELSENALSNSERPVIIVLSSYTPSLFWYRIDMMKSFIEKGYCVYAIADQPEKEWEERFREIGIRYRQVFIQRNGMNPIKDIRTLREIKKLYKELSPIKVFTYQAKSTIYGGIAARMIGGIQVYPMIGGVGSVFLSDTLKARLLRFIVTFEYRVAIKKAAAVFFQNADDEQTFRNNGIITNQTICRLPGSGVNTEWFMPMKLPSEIAFLLVARLIKDKGVMEYLEACVLLKNCFRDKDIRCLLVGPFDTNPTAVSKELIESYVDKGIIEYYGNQDDVRPYIEQCSVFVLPSYREGTPKAVLEAMACGRVIITTDTVGCKETVINEKNGFLVPIKDSLAVFDKMKYLVNNPEKIASMAKESRKIAEERFDVRIVNNKICKTMGIV